MEHDQFARRRKLTDRHLGAWMLVALLWADLHAGTTAAGEVYKCKGADGSVTFTNIRCPDKSQVLRYGSYQPAADSPDQYYQAAEQAQAIRESKNDASSSSASPPANQGGSAVLATPQQPEGNIVRCTKPNGTVYYRRTACGASSVVVDSGGGGAPRMPTGPVFNSDGSINPDAHWTGPNQAIDAYTGQFLQGPDLQHPFNHTGPNARDNVVSVPDRAEHVDKATGCSGAKDDAQRVRARGGSFDARRKADDRVWDLCNRPANSTR